MKHTSMDDLNTFAQSQMAAAHYTPDKILVDLRFLKDWLVGGTTYMLTHGKRRDEILRISGEIANRAQSEDYQNRIFDDPSILNPTQDNIRYRDVVDFISNADINVQRTILQISPMTTFLQMLSARTVININHSVVEEKTAPIHHVINCFPFNSSDIICDIIKAGMSTSQCTRISVVRRNPAAAPISAFDKYQHVYMFETEEFLRRESVRESFSLTAQLTKRWSMADLYGHTKRQLVHPIDHERERLSKVMSTMTEFELIPTFLFLPILPESTISTTVSRKDK